MITGVGLSASASCAAIRCGINNFSETRFLARSGDWIIGSEVRTEEPWRGLTKQSGMACAAIRECISTAAKGGRLSSPVPLVLCLAEEERPGRLPGLGGALLLEIERELGMKFHADSSVVALGRVGAAVGLLRAQRLIQDRNHPYVILAGVDSYLTAPTLLVLEEVERLLTNTNSNGFVPGEAAAAVLLGHPVPGARAPVICRGLGFGRETAAADSRQPLRADGMVEAIRAALSAAGIGLERVDHRISDVSGEQYRFKEAALAVNRILRERKAELGMWHPADSIGEAGAAALPVMLGVLYYAASKRYLPGRVFLAHLSNDDDKRAALILTAEEAA
jgi:3-oxoacyl-[acyl-carrier-protein] synthase-1